MTLPRRRAVALAHLLHSIGDAAAKREVILALEDAPRFPGRAATPARDRRAVRQARTGLHPRGRQMTLPRRRPLLLLVTLLVLSASLGYAQWRRRNSEGPIYYTEGGDMVDSRTVKDRPRDRLAQHRHARVEESAGLRPGYLHLRPHHSRPRSLRLAERRQLDHRFSRQRPEPLLPAPADDLDQGEPRRDASSGSPIRSCSAIHSFTWWNPAPLLLRDEGGRDPAPLSAPWRFSHGRRFLGRVAVGRVRRADEARLPGSRLRGAADEPRNLSLRLRSRHGEE